MLPTSRRDTSRHSPEVCIVAAKLHVVEVNKDVGAWGAMADGVVQMHLPAAATNVFNIQFCSGIAALPQQVDASVPMVRGCASMS